MRREGIQKTVLGGLALLTARAAWEVRADRAEIPEISRDDAPFGVKLGVAKTPRDRPRLELR